MVSGTLSNRNASEEYLMQASSLSAGQTVPQTKAAWYEPLVDRDLVPDWILRAGIRRLIAERLQNENKGDPERQQAHLMSYVAAVESQSHRHSYTHSESAALRSSRGVLRLRPRGSPKIHLLLLARRRHARCGGAPYARFNRGARANRGRAFHPRS